MQDYSFVAQQIIKAQMVVIGPLAIAQAQKVVGLSIQDADHIEIIGNAKDVLSNLVNQYAQLFGRASIEVCKDAIKEMQSPIPSKDLPDILQ